MGEPERGYRAYLLRLWRVEEAGCPNWRASIEEVRTRERHGFANLDALLAWLREEATRAAGGAEPACMGKARR
ncbi:MAG: hypothetical protein GX557_10600 [Chloroflexi bacterium]|nr:hypothetical protein [Chloroflexota bacterium]